MMDTSLGVFSYCIFLQNTVYFYVIISISPSTSYMQKRELILPSDIEQVTDIGPQACKRSNKWHSF